MGCTDKNGLLIGCGMKRVKNYSKIFDLSSWKDRIALREERLERSRLERDDQELSVGHAEFAMPIRHPSVGVQYCLTVFLNRNNDTTTVYSLF